MSKYESYYVWKGEVFGYRVGAVYKDSNVMNEKYGALCKVDEIVKSIEFPGDLGFGNVRFCDRSWEIFSNEEEAVRSLDEWVNIDAKYTVFKLENTKTKKRIGFIYCGDVSSYSHAIADYIKIKRVDPETDSTLLRKEYVNMKAIEEYDNREEADRSLNDFLNGNEPE